jgi:type I restriction enzyme S subunit
MERKRVPLGNYITEYSVRNRSGEDIPVYSVTNSQGFCTEYFDKEVASKDKTTYKIVPRGYFAYNPSRINVGSVDWQRCEGRVIVSPLYNVFSVSEKMEQQYLFYFLKSNVGRQMIKAKASGSVRDNLKMDMLKEMTIPERTIEEQKKCVATLDALKTIISLWEKELEKLDELIKARFVELFGDPRSNPFGFEKKMLKDTCKVITGNTPSRAIAEYYGDYIEWIKTDNIVSGILNPTQATESLSEKGMNVGRTVEKDSILMACIAGSIASIGRVCITDRTVAFNQQINAVVPEQYNILFLYVLLQMSKDYLVEDINMALKGILSKSKLEEKEFIIPPMDLQEQFSDFVKQVDKSKVIDINIILKGGVYNGNEFFVS